MHWSWVDDYFNEFLCFVPLSQIVSKVRILIYWKWRTLCIDVQIFVGVFYCRLANFHHQAAQYQLFLPYCKVQWTSRHWSTPLITLIIWTWLKAVTTYLHRFLLLLLQVNVHVICVITKLRGWGIGVGQWINKAKSEWYLQYCIVV